MLTSWKNVPRAFFIQICAAITEKCILIYSSVNITDNLLIIEEVITASLIIISDTAKVILTTDKLKSATEATVKVNWATTKVTLATNELILDTEEVSTAILKVVSATTNTDKDNLGHKQA